MSCDAPSDALRASRVTHHFEDLLCLNTQLRFQDVVDGLRVGFAARGFHHLADEPAEGLRLVLDLGDLFGVRRDDLVHDLFDGAGIGDLFEAVLLDDGFGLAALFDHARENLFAGAIPFVGSLNILPLLMSASMVWQQKMTTPATAATPEQQQQQKMMMVMMPIMMLFFFYTMPSGLVLYWTTSNLMMIGQTGLRNLRKKIVKA